MIKTSNIIPLPARSNIARVSLNDATPPGLFETDEGNRYLVADQSDFSVAIALAHTELPTFTWFSLPASSIAAGRHWADWRLRLMTAYPSCSDDEAWAREGNLGDMMVSETGVSLNCIGMDGTDNWIGLSAVKEKSRDLRDYSGWALDVLNARETFFEQGLIGTESLRVLHSRSS